MGGKGNSMKLGGGKGVGLYDLRRLKQTHTTFGYGSINQGQGRSCTPKISIAIKPGLCFLGQCRDFAFAVVVKFRHVIFLSSDVSVNSTSYADSIIVYCSLYFGILPCSCTTSSGQGAKGVMAKATK